MVTHTPNGAEGLRGGATCIGVGARWAYVRTNGDGVRGHCPHTNLWLAVCVGRGGRVQVMWELSTLVSCGAWFCARDTSSGVTDPLVWDRRTPQLWLHHDGVRWGLSTGRGLPNSRNESRLRRHRKGSSIGVACCVGGEVGYRVKSCAGRSCALGAIVQWHRPSGWRGSPHQAS